MNHWWERCRLPDPVCMVCGKDCEITEVVDIGGEKELWCYCPKCDAETFHPLIKSTD
ncbi:MAG: hypothetical protein P4L67_04305 [Candidatus Pacebacteria bacterium]|nr:hypothetical protein [Candidatus Paceibacterota bacterium]